MKSRGGVRNHIVSLTVRVFMTLIVCLALSTLTAARAGLPGIIRVI